MTKPEQGVLHPADGLIALLLIGLAVLRVMFLLTNQLELSADEMHYWDWSRRLDLAYYSKGPVVALLIAASRSVFGDGQLGVRLPAVLLGNLLALLVYLHARRRLAPAAALTITLVVVTLPIVAGLGVAMTTDPPVLVCWAIALSALEPALRRGAANAWVLFGLACAVGVMAKYTTLILPVGVLGAALAVPFCRRLLRRSSFWIAQLLAAAGLLPLLLWNASNDWVNLAHNAGHLGLGASFSPAQLLLGPLEVLGAQWLLFGLITAPLLLLAAWRVVPVACDRRDPYPVVLAVLAGALLLLCLGVSLRRSVYANWPVPAGLIAVFLLIEAWPLPSFGPSPRRWLLVGSALNLFTVLAIHLPFFGVRLGLPHKSLPTRRLVGWQALASELRDRHGALLAGPPLLISDSYATASALAHGLQLPPGSIATADLGGRRMNQYDIWGRKDLPARAGEDALLVLGVRSSIDPLRPRFRRIVALGELDVVVDGETIRRFHLWRGEAYDGQPLPQSARR